MNKKALCLIGLGLLMKDTQAQGQLSGAQRDSLVANINTITTAVPFLLIAPDSRAGGMGDVGAATSPDANSIHWNPAKLAFVEKNLGFAVSYTPWLRALVNDINLAYLSGYKKLKGDQTLAMSLLYFSLGNITFTDNYGNTTGQFNPNEFAIDAAYARKLGEDFSGGIALRYIYSNLTGGIGVSNTTSHAGTSVAADVSVYYRHEIELSGKKTMWSSGVNISNIGSKVSYTETGTKDFIPTNFRIGTAMTTDLDEYNRFSFSLDANKLLVPSPPVYERDSSGGFAKDPNGNPIILAGKDPNVGVASAIFQSWSDAPGGFAEELKEWTWSAGMEYWYDKQFAVRAGYFHEANTKGARQYFTVGAGLKYNVFGLDFAYLIPTTQRNPLESTLRFTLLFDFDALKDENKDKESAE